MNDGLSGADELSPEFHDRQPADATTPPWTVERWGGQAHHKERVVFSGDEAAARLEFARLAPDVRQGTLRLRRPNGVTADISSGPRLRTRW